MAQLDQFLKALLAQPQGAEMLLATDNEPMLRLGDKNRPMVAKKLTAPHIRFLMGEITPEAVRTTLEERGFAEFAYLPPGLDRVLVSVKGWMGVTEVIFRAAAPAPELEARPRQ